MGKKERNGEMTDAFGITLYKPQEVAEKLGIGKNTIGRLLKEGEMDYVIWLSLIHI